MSLQTYSEKPTEFLTPRRIHLAARLYLKRELLRAELHLDKTYIPHFPEPKQIEFLRLECREALYGGAAGGGKALAIDTPIPTPGGWKLMGELEPGNLVFSETGEPTVILDCSPVMMGRHCYVVRFSDGAETVADADHGWLTLTDAERAKAQRRTEAFRAKRRKGRKRRGIGKRPDLARANAAREYHCLFPPQASVRTTSEISRTLTIRGRRNHSIEVAGHLRLAAKELLLDPYLLGAWLGDGTTKAGSITTADVEIVAAFERGGYDVQKQAGPYAYGIHGLATDLRAIGVMNNKHIPMDYLRASVEQRIALLQGLMDTDGYAGKCGQCEFTTTRPRLAQDVGELIRTLGIKASIRESRAKLYGKDCGPKFDIKFMACFPAFRLRRKLERQKTEGFRATVGRRYIVSVEQVPSEPVKCIRISAPSGCFLAGKDFIPTHNSDALLMAALQYVHVPGYAAIIFRRTFKDLALPEALIARSAQWLSGTDAHWDGTEYRWTFPSNATLSFGYLKSEGDKYRYQSSAYQYIGFDELTQFTETQYRYLFSRLRRLEGVTIPLRMRAASNPGGSGHEWVKLRYQLPEGRPDKPFIPANIDDNPHLDRAEYIESLNELDPITRAQLMSGDWSVRSTGGMFRREWFRIYDDWPTFIPRVRYWDLASTEPSDINPDPDWTVGALMGRHPNGTIWILDVKRVRTTPLGVKQLIRQTAELDGPEVPIFIEQEPGASGKALVQDFIRYLQGYAVRPIRPTGDKVTRARPFSSYSEAGNVSILAGPWVGAFLDELDAFPDGSHDDQVDAASGAFKELSPAGHARIGSYVKW